MSVAQQWMRFASTLADTQLVRFSPLVLPSIFPRLIIRFSFTLPISFRCWHLPGITAATATGVTMPICPVLLCLPKSLLTCQGYVLYHGKCRLTIKLCNGVWKAPMSPGSSRLQRSIGHKRPSTAVMTKVNYSPKCAQRH